MPFVLREGFSKGGSDLSAASGAPAAAAFEVLVDSVLLQEPVALAGVALLSCVRDLRYWLSVSAKMNRSEERRVGKECRL